MKKYTVDEIKFFLKAMDRFTTQKCKIIIIGGSAAALAYNVTTATQDIDSYNSINAAKEAYDKAKKETGLNIPFTKASVSDGPYFFEDRLIDFEPESFKNIKLQIPEVIDLILMKTVRGFENDIIAIEQMIENQKVKLKDLIDRYTKEMGSVVVISKDKLDLNFLVIVERCYGAVAAQKVQTLIGYKP